MNGPYGLDNKGVWFLTFYFHSNTQHSLDYGFAYIWFLTDDYFTLIDLMISFIISMLLICKKILLKHVAPYF